MHRMSLIQFVCQVPASSVFSQQDSKSSRWGSGLVSVVVKLFMPVLNFVVGNHPLALVWNLD